MTRPSWLWLSLGGSVFTHGVLGWQLSNAPLERHAPPERDTFEVRLLTLPPPAPPPEPEPPLAPPPPVPQPKVTVEPKLEAKAAKPPAPPTQASRAPEPAPPPEVTTAPPALLAESGLGAGSIVQLAGASIGALAIASRLPPAPPAAVPGASLPRGAPLAKLSDLSRKPRAPSLDAALRQNYPVEQRRRGTEGHAEVRVVIDRLGRVGEILVLSESAPGFADACRKTLLGSRWSEPLDREGQPVSTRLTYRCRFAIEK